jgi:hypothetical protein
MIAPTSFAQVCGAPSAAFDVPRTNAMQLHLRGLVGLGAVVRAPLRSVARPRPKRYDSLAQHRRNSGC